MMVIDISTGPFYILGTIIIATVMIASGELLLAVREKRAGSKQARYAPQAQIPMTRLTTRLLRFFGSLVMFLSIINAILWVSFKTSLSDYTPWVSETLTAIIENFE